MSPNYEIQNFAYEFVIFPLTWTPEEYVTQEDATVTTSQLYKNDSRQMHRGYISN